MSTTIPTASAWEQELYDHFVGHIDTERAILEEYQQLARDETLSPAFRYIANLILSDERRHHQVFGDLAEAIRQLGELRMEDEPIPSLRGLRADRDRVMATTDRLLAVEYEDRNEVKQLMKRMKDVRDTTLWGLLLELIRDDTDKHIKILKFIRDRANDSVI